MIPQRIAIHSVPRSGSTWLGELINSHPAVSYSYQPLFSYAFKGALDKDSRKKDVESFFSAIGDSDDDFIRQTENRSKGNLPIFKKDKTPKVITYKEVRYHYLLEHLLSVDDDIKVILLIRNPLAVINSWLKAPKEFRGDLGWSVTKEWKYAPSKNLNRIEEYNGFEKWKECTLLFHELAIQFPSRVFLLNYQDLICETEALARSVFKFIGLGIHEQTHAFIGKKSDNRETGGYDVSGNKSADDAWKKELDSEIIQEILKDIEGNSELKKYLNEN